jgi:GntR family transcriptional regulator
VHIHISTRDGVPIYLQIVRQIKHQIASGILAPGRELPSIRELAENILVNPNTVARAYRELETVGLVEKRRTAGTYVAEGPSPLARHEKVRMLSERMDGLLAEASQMKVPLEDLIELLHQRARAFAKKPPLQNPQDQAP